MSLVEVEEVKFDLVVAVSMLALLVGLVDSRWHAGSVGEVRASHQQPVWSNPKGSRCRRFLGSWPFSSAESKI